MEFTRSALLMMLEEMDKNNVDSIKVDVCVIGYEWNLEYIDFDIYNGTKYIKTVLTLE